jgi:NhaP-type Na+/H+ or K+/H+ antiporter
MSKYVVSVVLPEKKFLTLQLAFEYAVQVTATDPNAIVSITNEAGVV